MNGRTVYLAGGMRSGWQDRLIAVCDGGGFTFEDPRDNNTNKFEEYTVLDLHKVKISDIVFAYLEKDNPGGQGACVECGFAKGLGKTVIIVNEKPEDRYLRFIEKVADIVFNDFNSAVEFLKKLGIKN